MSPCDNAIFKCSKFENVEPWGFPGGSVVKNLPAPGLGIFPGEGNGNLLQYSCLGIPMDREEPGGPQSTGHTRGQT